MTSNVGRSKAGRSSSAFNVASLVEQSPFEIFVIDAANGHYLYANDRAVANTGYSLDELLLLTPLDLQVDADVQTIMGRVAALRDGSATFIEFHATYRRKDGTTYTVEQRTEYLAGHEPPVFVARIRETDATDADLVTTSADDTYRRIVEDAEQGVWAIDAENRTTYVNDRMARMLGYTRDEMIGAPLFSFMDDEDRAIANEKMARRQAGESERHDFRFIRKDGEELWVIVAAHPDMSADGRYLGATAVITDITERKRRERALLATLHLATNETANIESDGTTALAFRMPSISGLKAARVAGRFSVLADPRRLELIELLASGEERSVGALAEALRMSQSNVSKHLRILDEAGLVSRRLAGSRAIYSICDPTLVVICRVVYQWVGNQAQAEYQALAAG